MADANQTGMFTLQAPKPEDIGQFFSSMFKQVSAPSSAPDPAATPAKAAGGSTNQSTASTNQGGIGSALKSDAAQAEKSVGQMGDAVSSLLKNVGGTAAQGAEDIGNIVNQLMAFL